VRHGKDFFLDLLNAKALTWTAEYILVAGSLLLLSSMLFLMSSSFSLYELNGLAKNPEKKVHVRIVFAFFVGGLVLLFLALISAIILRYL
jgi:TRAP-type C4-dicarboxylate transport system permease small subunit